MKHKSYIQLFILIGFITLNVLSCTEKFELKTESFEDVLVVEATLTDEFKTHKIKLSRTYLLENDTIVQENNAIVKIEDGNKNVYNFHDAGNGIYLSDDEFQAVPGVSYKLEINTTDGKQYISNEEILPAKAKIDNLYPELVDLKGKPGVQIFVDTNDNLGDAQFFRYEYQETYKIIVPLFANRDTEFYNVKFNLNGIDSYNIRFVDRPSEQEVCYTTNYSGIILTNANTVTGNKIARFPIRFTGQDDLSVFRVRYSILVRQYVQTANAYNFYRILKELNGDVSLLLDIQPGFIKGNINSKQSDKEKVIGYFDVSSVDSKRIYFNYNDLGIDFPSYFYKCDIKTLDYNKIDEIDGSYKERIELYTYLSSSSYKFYSNEDSSEIYTIVSRPCGDCTYFSSSIKPAFWED